MSALPGHLLLPNGQRLAVAELVESSDSILEFVLDADLAPGTICWIESPGDREAIEARIESKAAGREGNGFRYFAKRATPSGAGEASPRRFRLWGRG